MSRKLLGFGTDRDMEDMVPNDGLEVIDEALLLKKKRVQASEPLTQKERPEAQPFWSMTVEAVYEFFDTSIQGLTKKKVEERLAKYGPNAFPEEEEEGFLQQLLNAFKDKLVIILMVCSLLQAGIGLFNSHVEDLIGAGFIFLIVVVMVRINYQAEANASSELKKLKELQRSTARVIRGNVLQEVDAQELVVGDIIIVQEGDKVPADARVVTSLDGRVNESTFTGEPYDISKSAEPVAANSGLHDRRSMVHSGTSVQGGNMTAAVVATGMDTQLGDIWDQLNTAEETQTPLQKQLGKLADRLTPLTFLVCLAVLVVYIIRGEPILSSIIVAVSLAIAFIPEALGVVIKIALANGVEYMVNHGAIIKKPEAAEGLGSVTVVLSDKTGTITRGEMTATHMWTLGHNVRLIEAISQVERDAHTSLLIEIAHFCNDLGNPTDKALAAMTRRMGLELTADSRENRVYQAPFTSDRKMMSIANRSAPEANLRMRTKGAPDRLIERCTFVLRNGDGVVPMTPSIASEIHEAVRAFESQGSRVLAFADRELDGVLDHEIGEQHESGLTFVGLIALNDPPRPEVKEAVARMRAAGVAAKMITGDSPLTALWVAQEVDMADQQTTVSDVVMGEELDNLMRVSAAGDRTDFSKLNPDDLSRIKHTKVFARTSPRQKKWLVEAHQYAGDIVAMIGDGVNDAPSIKAADIGVAIGEKATEITKEAAKVVITRGYEAIVTAIEVGRTILYRTRLYAMALLSTNTSEVEIFIVAVLLGWAAPFTTIQLLLINVLGDSSLSIALAKEAPEADIMQQKPRDPKESIITPYMLGVMVYQGILTTFLMAMAWILTGDYAQSVGLSSDATITLQRSVLFCVFMIQKVLRSAFTARSFKFNLSQIGFFTNRYSLRAALVVTFVTVVSLYIPFLGMMPLPLEILPLLSLGVIPPAVEEMVKFVRQLLNRQTASKLKSA
jgi:Ca2+-transporting ATPase